MNVVMWKKNLFARRKCHLGSVRSTVNKTKHVAFHVKEEEFDMELSVLQ